MRRGSPSPRGASGSGRSSLVGHVLWRRRVVHSRSLLLLLSAAAGEPLANRALCCCCWPAATSTTWALFYLVQSNGCRWARIYRQNKRRRGHNLSMPRVSPRKHPLHRSHVLDQKKNDGGGLISISASARIHDFFSLEQHASMAQFPSHPTFVPHGGHLFN